MGIRPLGSLGIRNADGALLLIEGATVLLSRTLVGGSEASAVSVPESSRITADAGLIRLADIKPGPIEGGA